MFRITCAGCGCPIMDSLVPVDDELYHAQCVPVTEDNVFDSAEFGDDVKPDPELQLLAAFGL